MSDDSKKTEGSLTQEPDIAASLKELASAASESNKSASSFINSPEAIRNVVEGAIMAAAKAISIDKILTLFPEDETIGKDSIRQALDELMQVYQNRGIDLVEVSSGFRFQVAQSVAPQVSRLWEEKPQKYSRALLETLALVAYRQPVTRGEIEEIRGVSVSSQIMRTLVEREWVRVIGHRDVPGKPAMYATTKTFLDYFGLKKLDELPNLSEIRDLDVIDAELDFGDNNAKAKVEEKSEADNTDPEKDEPSNEAESEVDLLNNLRDLEENVPDEEIDIDAELRALKETYQKIDAIDKENNERESE